MILVFAAHREIQDPLQGLLNSESGPQPMVRDKRISVVGSINLLGIAFFLV